MKITFVLPNPTIKIAGGYKVVYEYANYLVERGHSVTILYKGSRGKNGKKIPPWLAHCIRIFLAKKGPFWFSLDKKIQRHALFEFSNDKCPDGDIVIATAADTAPVVNQLHDEKGKKFYFVQDYENWYMSDDELTITYTYDMTIITIAKWLREKVSPYTQREIHYIPNGIDTTVFYPKNYDKKRYSIGMLYHMDIRKGCDVGLKVIDKLKQRYPELDVQLFGSPQRDEQWPAWIQYTRNAKPSQVCEIMNNVSVFLCTSRVEGFGLTGLESLFCGCTLVSTDSMGVREYAENTNTVLCEIDNVDDIYNKVCMVFDDIEQYQNIDREVISQFDIAKSKKEFEKVLINSIK